MSCVDAGVGDGGLVCSFWNELVDGRERVVDGGLNDEFAVLVGNDHDVPADFRHEVLVICGREGQVVRRLSFGEVDGVDEDPTVVVFPGDEERDVEHGCEPLQR